MIIIILEKKELQQKSKVKPWLPKENITVGTFITKEKYQKLIENKKEKT